MDNSPSALDAELAALQVTIARFDSGSRARGDNYFRNNTVFDLKIEASNFSCKVSGSRDYDVTWRLHRGVWTPSCPCPVGPRCKHAYAAAREFASGAIARAQPDPDASTAATKSRGNVPASASTSAPLHQLPIAEQFGFARDHWERSSILRRMLARPQFNTALAFHGHFSQILDDKDLELLCWRLAQAIREETGGEVPEELTGYVHRPDLEERLSQREQRLLFSDVTKWLAEPVLQMRRSLRFVMTATADRRTANIGIEGRITTNRVQDAVLGLNELDRLRAEAEVRPGTLSPDDMNLLVNYLDAHGRALYMSLNHSPIVRVLLTVAAASAGSLGVVWHASLSQEAMRRGGIAPGAPVLFDPRLVSLVPHVRETESGLLADLGLRFPDGEIVRLEDTLFMFLMANPSRADAAVVARGHIWKVVEAPPPPICVQFLHRGPLSVTQEHRSSIVLPLVERYAHVREAVEPHIRYLDATPLVALDLRDDDWLQIRVLAHSIPGEWMPHYPIPAGASVLEFQPPGTWKPLDMDSAPATYDGFDRKNSGSQDLPLPTNSADSKERVWFVAPQAEIVRPAEEWLTASGATDGRKAASGGVRPDAPDRHIGWWMRASAKRMAQLAELWETRPPGIRFVGTERVRRLLSAAQTVRPKIKVQASGVDWFSVSAEWQSEGLALSDSDMAKLRASRERFVRLPSGWVAKDAVDAHSESADILADLGIEIGGGEQRITLWTLAGADAASLSALEAMGAGEEAASALRKLRKQVSGFRGVPAVPVPKKLSAELRPYQQQGLDFLCYASDLGIGVILADDMGLGKTVQTLAWLQRLIDKQPKGGPSLVVCPTSVMHNWRREAARFAPKMKVLVLEAGAERHETRKLANKYDLVVTNYALLRRDIDDWREIALRAAILDEAQNIKNPDSMSARAACNLNAKYRLALTGTPLENRPLDLWSIVEFVNPGYLGTRTQFGVRYDRADAPPHSRKLLAAKLRPILLRRLKREVAKDLPERIEERRDCEMTEGQRKLYLAELRRSQKLVGELSRDDESLKKNKILILAALTRLRQICCHPVLAKGAMSLGSGKFEAFFELLEPLLDEGHKVLVFSQFVECLNLLEAELADRDVATFKLTGQTKRRDALVNAFQTDERPGVFLISLKAGGTGLNLTAASYVVLFDPWWNPAAEAQAIDRTHRIGQDKTVIAYRLIARGTIEEKIWELQQKKLSMVRDILGEDGFGRSLNRDDLTFLLNDDFDDN